MTPEVTMKLAKLAFVALILACEPFGVAIADEKPFNQEEWQRGVDEIMHPKPGDPKLEAVWKAKDLRESTCAKQYIEKNAAPDSKWTDLAELACQACDKEVQATGVASYNASKIKTPLTADKDKSIKSSRDMCRFIRQTEAQQLVWDKQWEVKKARDDTLKAQYEQAKRNRVPPTDGSKAE